MRHFWSSTRWRRPQWRCDVRRNPFQISGLTAEQLDEELLVQDVVEMRRRTWYAVGRWLQWSWTYLILGYADVARLCAAGDGVPHTCIQVDDRHRQSTALTSPPLFPPRISVSGIFSIQGSLTFSLEIFYEFSMTFHDLQGSFCMTARRRAAVHHFLLLQLLLETSDVITPSNTSNLLGYVTIINKTDC